MIMASLPQPTALSPLHLIARQRLPLLLLLVISLVAATIATVALQRQATIPAAPARVVPTTGMDQQRAIVDAYEQLQFQWMAAEQARRAGSTEAYEIAVAGAEALQSRIAGLQAQPYPMTDQDRALIEAYEQFHVQRLAAEQALRARNTEAYEIATAGAEALQSRIATLRAE